MGRQQASPKPVPEHAIPPVLTSIMIFTTRHQRFTHVRLFDSHLPGLTPTFPTTLTTGALYPRSLWRFEACSCKPTSRGRPSSSVKHRKHRSVDARVLGTHCVVNQLHPDSLLDCAALAAQRLDYGTRELYQSPNGKSVLEAER